MRLIGVDHGYPLDERDAERLENINCSVSKSIRCFSRLRWFFRSSHSPATADRNRGRETAPAATGPAPAESGSEAVS